MPAWPASIGTGGTGRRGPVWWRQGRSGVDGGHPGGAGAVFPRNGAPADRPCVAWSPNSGTSMTPCLTSGRRHPRPRSGGDVSVVGGIVGKFPDRVRDGLWGAGTPSQRRARAGDTEGSDLPPLRVSWGLWVVADDHADAVKLAVPGRRRCRHAPDVRTGWCQLAPPPRWPRPAIGSVQRRPGQTRRAPISLVRSPPVARRSAGLARPAQP